MSISDSKIEILDLAFLGTMDSQGFKNAKLAVKYVLFDDEEAIAEKLKGGDKWRFISSKNNGRELCKSLHHSDLMHMLVKFCFSYFGLSNKPFTFDKEKYEELKDNFFPSMALNTKEMVEYVVYATLISVEEAYVLLGSHKDLVMSLVDLLINERYLEDRREELDSFKEIGYPRMKINEYNYFIEKYNTIDLEFSLLKRNISDYN